VCRPATGSYRASPVGDTATGTGRTPVVAASGDEPAGALRVRPVAKRRFVARLRAVRLHRISIRPGRTSGFEEHHQADASIVIFGLKF